MTWKEKSLIFLAGLVAWLAAFASFFSRKKNDPHMVKDLYDEKRKNYDLQINANHNRIDASPLEVILKDGEHIQVKPDSED